MSSSIPHPSASPDVAPSTTLYLIRHGEPDQNFHGRLYGQEDVPLSDRGMRQSEALAERLSGVPFDAVYSSTLQRAGYMADLIADRFGLPVRRLDVLRERNLGMLQGMPPAEMHERHPEEARAYFADPVYTRPPGGENYEDVRDRVMEAVRTLVEAFRGGRIAVVSHAGPIRIALGESLGMPLSNVYRFRPDYACVNVIEFPPDSIPRVKLVNG